MKFGENCDIWWNCDIWCNLVEIWWKLLNLLKIVKFGGNCEICQGMCFPISILIIYLMEAAVELHIENNRNSDFGQFKLTQIKSSPEKPVK